MKINIDKSIDDKLALELVLAVIKRGRISTARDGHKIYCLATVFSLCDDDKHEYVVIVNEKCKGDSFSVYKKEKLTMEK